VSALLATLLLGLAQAPHGVGSRAEIESFLDGMMLANLRDKHVAGATVAVVKDGAVLLAKGYGWADVEKRVPVDAERTLFRIGSISKLFTWTAVLQLVEEGKLSLDADVNGYLDFEIPATFPARSRCVT
jgi:CubicO group peptidase (beta-lactamase class C family)